MIPELALVLGIIDKILTLSIIREQSMTIEQRRVEIDRQQKAFDFLFGWAYQLGAKDPNHPSVPKLAP